MQSWTCERHDKITYLVVHTRLLGGGTITKLSRSKWHAESDDTGDVATCPTLTKAFWWIIEQAQATAREK